MEGNKESGPGIVARTFERWERRERGEEAESGRGCIKDPGSHRVEDRGTAIYRVSSGLEPEDTTQREDREDTPNRQQTQIRRKEKRARGKRGPAAVLLRRRDVALVSGAWQE